MAFLRIKGADSYKYLFILDGDANREVILAWRYYIQRAHHNWMRELWFNAIFRQKIWQMYLSKDGLPIEKSSLFQGYDMLSSEFQDRDQCIGITFYCSRKYHFL